MDTKGRLSQLTVSDEDLRVAAGNPPLAKLGRRGILMTITVCITSPGRRSSSIAIAL